MEEINKKEGSALYAPTLFKLSGENNIAYRIIGKGATILLCNRFRGTLDTWDPLFLDSLACSHQVITFDYPGIGRSSGKLATTIIEVANDVKSFIDALGLKNVTLGGWSYGGTVAQTVAAHYPELLSHLIVIGSNPPGKNDTPPEQVFFDAALKPVNDFDDEVVLFFEPRSKASIAAAKASHDRIGQRTEDLSVPVTPEVFNNYFKGGADFREDTYESRQKLSSSNLPILILMGDHDPSFPIENWYPIIKVWESAQLIILPRAGHGPQHEFPELTSDYISSFIKFN